jgi:hypothetical protein
VHYGKRQDEATIVSAPIRMLEQRRRSQRHGVSANCGSSVLRNPFIRTTIAFLGAAVRCGALLIPNGRSSTSSLFPNFGILKIDHFTSDGRAELSSQM